MKLPAGLFAMLGLYVGLSHLSAASNPVTVILVGGHDGYLAPCGCTFPMTGGLLRAATMVRTLARAKGKAGGRSVILDTGDLVQGDSRQDQLKAETLAEALGSLGAAAANVTARDADLGLGVWLSASSLAPGIFTTGSLNGGATEFWKPEIESGGLMIMGASADPKRLAGGLEAVSRPLDESVGQLVSDAKSKSLVPVLLFDGDEIAAAEIAQKFPDLGLVTYRSSGSPPTAPVTIGSTALVTVGEHGQFVVSVAIGNGASSGYAVQKLGPDVVDDGSVTDIYREYLHRVEKERLWEQEPRLKGTAFVGSERCGSCHAQAYAVWKRSKHAGALATLESKGHGKDPECLLCHITGAAFSSGYTSKAATPQLAAVGCESCHTDASQHAAHPRLWRLPKLGENACASCHALLNSPNFAFPKYWARIRH